MLNTKKSLNLSLLKTLGLVAVIGGLNDGHCRNATGKGENLDKRKSY
jgi:hypothetical protein